MTSGPAPPAARDEPDVPRVVLVVALKILLPLAIPALPLAAGWADFLLDSFDGDVLVPAGVAEPTCQILDKATEWLACVAISVCCRRTPIRREIVATFLLRSVGEAQFFVTRNDPAFFFPNLLQPLLVVYVTIARPRGLDRAQVIHQPRARAIRALVLPQESQDEWVTRGANLDRGELPGRLLGRRPGGYRPSGA